MVVNIYDTANQMERDLRATQEFTALKEAYAELKKDADTFKLFKQFQTLQMQLQQKQYAGQQPTDDEIKEIQATADKVREVKAIQNLMEKERGIDELLSGINNVITKPIQELYQE